MWEKIANLLKTCYARATCHEQPDPKKWVFSSVHNRTFNYNSSALFQYVKVKDHSTKVISSSIIVHANPR